ncbi:mannitol dehydrogenase family protein [Aeromicrobium sp. CTD01-1L150]|uniref:mannitol dehydrogenase family protein n=1 Tax=Aeromicrobium sp. CTD01-1L150 TaxID=3341830 RepID=UPI0035C0D37D
MRVSKTTMDDLPIPGPGYARDDVTSGIVHIGVGGFHRAHQAMYLDALLRDGGDRTWGLTGIGLMPGDTRMRDVLDAQDGLYTLVVEQPDGTRDARVIGSILRYLYAPDDVETAIEVIASPTTRIVSLTVTEGGYGIDQETGEFGLDDPAVQADLARPERPRTVFGLVAAGLQRRRERGLLSPTIMSCDNVQANGEVARSAFVGFAQALDARFPGGRSEGGLAAWMQEHTHFPSSMVDRITPVTPASLSAEVSEQFGVEDGWPVVAEPYTAWVLEDDFGAGRPELERVGVQLVDDVTPYELMKLRLLNASHQGIAYLGHLCGYRLVHEAAQDPLFEDFLLAYMEHEAVPTLPEVPGVDLDGYCRTLIERFANPRIGDTIARLAAESSDRIPTWLLPVVRENLRTGGPIECSATIIAAWARYAEGVDEAGEPIDVVDRLAQTLTPIAQRQREEPTAFIAHRRVFGDLVDDERFVTAYTDALASLHTHGARATLQDLAQPHG